MNQRKFKTIDWHLLDDVAEIDFDLRPRMVFGRLSRWRRIVTWLRFWR